MARALMGHLGSGNERVLALEIVRLRRRVAELEAELDTLREHGVEAHSLELELHQLAGTPEPALA